MKTHIKTIDGYHCAVEIDPTEDPSTQGWISKGSFSGSLQSVLDQGHFTTSCGASQCEIPDSILHRIEDWAHSVGY